MSALRTGLVGGVMSVLDGKVNDNLSAKGADIASSATLNLNQASGDLVDVTGTTTITAITLDEGLTRTVRFTGALTLTNGSSLVTGTGGDITTAAGDFAIIRGYASGVVRVVNYQIAGNSAVGDMVLASVQTVTGAKTFGSAGAVGKLKVAGTTSGSTIIDATAIAGSGTVTLPTTGTLATLAGAEALTNKTLTSPVITAPAGATSTGLMITKRVLFTENATNTIHTGTVTLPAGAWLHSIEVTNQVLWGAASAVLKVGDTADDDGYFVGVDCKATDLVVGEVLSTAETTRWGGKNGAYLVSATGRRGPTATNFAQYYVAGSDIIGVMTVGTPAVTTGRTIMSVTYSVGEALSAVASS